MVGYLVTVNEDGHPLRLVVNSTLGTTFARNGT